MYINIFRVSYITVTIIIQTSNNMFGLYTHLNILCLFLCNLLCTKWSTPKYNILFHQNKIVYIPIKYYYITEYEIINRTLINCNPS